MNVSLEHRADHELDDGGSDGSSSSSKLSDEATCSSPITEHRICAFALLHPLLHWELSAIYALFPNITV